MDNSTLGYLLLTLFASVILIAWLTIDDEDFDKRFEQYRKSGED
jgi:hypothetical protein